MKLFGEFLVDKGLIDKCQLADALVEQVRGMPSYAELAWKLKLLTAEELLAVLKLQSQRRIGFLESLRELGLAKPEIEQAILKGEVSSRVPLGEILVKKGVISLEKITHSLDEFLGEIKSAPTAAVAAPAPAPTPAPVSEPVPEKAKPQAASYGIFLETYTPEVMELLATISEGFLSGTSLGRDKVKTAFDEIHRVRGAARLVGAAKSEEYCALLEGHLQATLLWENIPEDLQKNIGRTMKAWCEVMGGLRDALAGGKNEADFFGAPDTAVSLEKLANFLEILKFNVEMAG